jgi:hypothetical protein
VTGDTVECLRMVSRPGGRPDIHVAILREVVAVERESPAHATRGRSGLRVGRRLDAIGATGGLALTREDH